MGTLNKAVEIKNLSFGYNGHQILQNVDVDFFRNEFTVILGRNGSGKSTLLRLMAGLLPHCTGDIKINGTQHNRLSNPVRDAKIGFLAQNHKAVFPFSVQEVVLTGRAAFINYLPGKTDHKIALDALEKTGIIHLKNRIYTELSGGEQQMVMIARLLARQPEILLLDEPISHLDYNNQIRIIHLIKELIKEGLTIISVLHDPNMAFLSGDKFVFVHNGKVEHYHGKEPWKAPLVSEIFHHNLTFIPHGEKVVFIPLLQ